MTSIHKTGWDTPTTEALASMWREGLSLTEISCRLSRQHGRTVTRNAIMGKIDRLGLSRQNRQAPAEPKIPGKPGPKPKVLMATTFKAPPPPEAYKPAPEILTGTVRPVDLKACHCRWPVGDPGADDFLFCGRDKVEGKPYCPDHCEVAYYTPDRSPEAFMRQVLRGVR